LLPAIKVAPVVREKACSPNARRATSHCAHAQAVYRVVAMVMSLYVWALTSEFATTSNLDVLDRKIAVPSPPATNEARKIAILAAA
jgi:hypothetical protein